MSLQVWLPLNGDLTSQGLSNVTVINNGATLDNSGKIGKCYSLATGDYLGLDAANVNNHKYSPISLAMWFYPTQNDSTGRHLMGCWESGGGGLYLKNQKIGFEIYINAYKNCEMPSTITLNTWHHICGTYDEAMMRLYIDGQEVATNPVSGTITYHSTCPWQIGGNPGPTAFGSGTIAGKINDVRIYDHALSAQEVAKLAQGLILHYPLSSPSDVLVPSGYQQLEYLESTGTQYIDTGLSMPKGFKLKTKISFNDLSASSVVLAANTGNSSDYKRNYFSVSVSGSTQRFIIGHGSNSSTGYTYITTATTNTDYTIDVSNIYGNRYCIINGVNYTISNTNTENTYTDLSLALFGTHAGSNFTPSMKGKMYYSQIYDYQNNCVFYSVPAKRLSDNVLGMYDVITKTFFTNAGTGTFTAGPNAPVSSPVYDISGFKNHGTVVGSLTAAAGGPRYKSCTQSSGNGNELITIATLNIATDNQFSFSCFVKQTAKVASSKIINLALNDSLFINFGNDSNATASSDQCIVFTNGTHLIRTNPAIPLNEWHHWAATWDGTTLKVYKDGVQVASNTTKSNYTDLTIPYSSSVSANGIIYKPNAYVSDVRIYTTVLNVNDIVELYQLGKV